MASSERGEFFIFLFLLSCSFEHFVTKKLLFASFIIIVGDDDNKRRADLDRFILSVPIVSFLIHNCYVTLLHALLIKTLRLIISNIDVL